MAEVREEEGREREFKTWTPVCLVLGYSSLVALVAGRSPTHTLLLSSSSSMTPSCVGGVAEAQDPVGREGHTVKPTRCSFDHSVMRGALKHYIRGR